MAKVPMKTQRIPLRSFTMMAFCATLWAPVMAHAQDAATTTKAGDNIAIVALAVELPEDKVKETAQSVSPECIG